MTSLVGVCCLSLDNSLPTFLIVGQASFFHKLWPYWTTSCMSRLLDIPWLPDHSTTAWMCDLACSEGAHHCQRWAGRSPGDCANMCVLTGIVSIALVQLSKWSLKWQFMLLQLCRLVASITCQKYISELVMLFWQALLCVELEEDIKCKVVLHLNTVQAKCEGF